MKLAEKLLLIQSELKAPKNQRNTFGNYNYRSAEDILEALKPLLVKHKATMTIHDDLVVLGNHNPTMYQEEVYDNKSKSMVSVYRVTGDQRFYIKATVTLRDIESDEFITTSAFAREEETKKGQDASQTTGSTSSYARKYALNGMFAIDDTKDSDATNTHGKEETLPKRSENASQSDIIQIQKLYTKEEIDKVLKHYNVSLLSDLPKDVVLQAIAKRMK